jgi:hypothetical protein
MMRNQGMRYVGRLLTDMGACRLKLQNESYISLYDHTQQNWSLRFASNSDAVAFAQHVLIAKHLVAAEPSLVTMDVMVPEKGKVGLVAWSLNQWRY